MITAVRYAAITGDTDTAASAVEEAVVEAVELLEEELGRPLANAERTESMRPDRQGRLWPRATPITDSGDYETEGLALLSAPFGWPSIVNPTGTVSVTYTGGWADPTADGFDPDGDNPPTLPQCIQRDLAWAAYRLLHPVAPGASVAPAGATSLRLGDAAVTYGPDGAPDGIGGDTCTWWSTRTRHYRYAPVGTAVERVGVW